MEVNKAGGVMSLASLKERTQQQRLNFKGFQLRINLEKITRSFCCNLFLCFTLKQACEQMK